jgi:uncharacterized membrane protein
VTLDGTTLAAIVVMAVLTYATRLACYALVRRLPLSPRGRRALDAVPGAVLVALVAPQSWPTASRTRWQVRSRSWRPCGCRCWSAS